VLHGARNQELGALIEGSDVIGLGRHSAPPRSRQLVGYGWTPQHDWSSTNLSGWTVRMVMVLGGVLLCGLLCFAI